ncbi:bifunctional DNA-formamidopyrimidine glycosylase/DNA-(apurinic or apyrimidinic site) lyase [Thalassospiraceae bacterium LMO-SO8]|nr:bifunctional DNA-formamidopyrimidine glycosylase/DNA-(apurinic or apyrimidinic site) lyase [Alphaproteobacteria bacterium LMO-S08]WND77467.1 bifunctional DNA-formamidopyrimidine glycosylase/DNA-(apurinic or apyrimidinic site) lyase [Thalassospiraceae bacterium LMO-SO8]
MPELPEVETVRRGLMPAMQGKRLDAVIPRRPDLRFPLPDGFGQRLTGRTVAAIRRRAKFLMFDLDSPDVLIAHLGMSGSFRLGAAAFPEEKHDHVIFKMSGGGEVHYNDPRRFGFMDLWPAADLAAHPMLARLGPEPLDDDAFSGPVLAARLKDKKTPIKAALLDQGVVAGVGNIYACEALYRAGISPKRLAHTVQGARADRLAQAVKAVLKDAIASGGSSLRDHIRPDGELGYFQHSFDVYGRTGEACANAACGAPIRQIPQAGRSTFYCSRCQR